MTLSQSMKALTALHAVKVGKGEPKTSSSRTDARNLPDRAASERYIAAGVEIGIDSALDRRRPGGRAT